MKKATLLVTLVGVLAAGPVLAQESGRFLTGPVAWTPTIGVKDVGVDSNVFDDPAEREDRTATLTSAVDASATLTHLRVTGGALTEYVYFERFADQRSFTRRFSVRAEAPLTRVAPFALGTYERARDRQSPELDSRLYHSSRGVGVGTSVLVMARGSVVLSGRREQLEYDSAQPMRGVDVAERLNRDTDTGQVGFRVEITPLTSVTADGVVSRDTFPLSPQHNTSNIHLNAGVEFAPDAIIRGRARMGYHVMEPRGAVAVPFRGVTADVDLSYLLLGRTRFGGRYARDTAYSIDAPYYVLTTVGVDVEQLIAQRFLLIARGARQKSHYAAHRVLSLAARTDYVDTVAGGAGVRLSDTSRVTVMYELARRRSPIQDIRFDRQRMFTSLTYGF